MARVAINCRAVLHETIDVGYGNEYLDFVSRQRLCAGKLIQVKGIVIVNGGPKKSLRSGTCSSFAVAGAPIVASSAHASAEKSGSRPLSSIILQAIF